MIRQNDGVLLRKESNLKYVKAVAGRRERMMNFNFYLDKMIGKGFGTAYEVQGSQLVQIDPRKYELEVVECGGKEDRDNRDLCDDSDSQKMSRDEIMKLKTEGMDGSEIVEKLVDSSATFKEKTVYSQAKYIKKKKKKHLAYFTTYKPTARLLSQLYFTKAPSKILDMRPDTLAQILTWSDVKFGSKVLVTETCQGLLLGAVLERIGENGKIVQAYNGNCPVRIIFNQFNFDEERKKKQICGFSYENLDEIMGRLESGVAVSENGSMEVEKMEEEKIISDEKNSEQLEMLTSSEAEEQEGCKNLNSNDDGSLPCNKFYTKEKREYEEQNSISHLQKCDLDALIIATKFHPLNLLVRMIKFIKPSSPIIVYCQHKEPLMECYTYLRDASLAINVHLTETWFRELQVLQDRTHPEIRMSGRSGYILRALKIKTDDTMNDSEPKAKVPRIQ